MPSKSSRRGGKPKGLGGGGGGGGGERPQFFSTGTRVSIRLLSVAVAAAYFTEKTFGISAYLFPHGPPVEFDGPLECSPVDSSNDLLQAKHGKTKKIFERGSEGLVKGPETVVFDPKTGTLYLMTEESKLVKLTDFQDDDATTNHTTTARAKYVRDLGAGRPLGGKFTPDGKTLYIADSLLGLVRIRDPEDHRSKLEVVLSSVRDDDGNLTRLNFADDVAVGPKSGRVYFSDASDIAPDRVGTSGWDPLHASKLDLMRGGPGTGRIIEYDPKTEATRILAGGLKFANGVAVDRDETFVLFAETFGINLYKYHLQGEKKDTLEVVVAGRDLPGFIDGVDCSWSGSGKCYAVIMSSVPPIVRLLHWLPDTLSILLRSVLMLLPRNLAPDSDRYGAILELDAKTNEFRLIQDPTGTDISSMTGITEFNNKLYMASLKHNYLGVYSLD